MGQEQYNIKKDCPECDCIMIRMLSHPTYICFGCRYEEKDMENRETI
jgi:phage FluMu protein Com